MEQSKAVNECVYQKHPKAFYLIFLVEFWERFGYYVMNTIVVYFFLVQYLHFSETAAFNLFGAFSAFLWGFIIIGGYIGDKVFGTKRTIILGAVGLLIGYLLLSISDATTVYFALAVIVVSEGLFKANPSSLLTKAYQKNDPRLHSAFTYYYMAINIGSLIATFAAPAIAEKWGWNIAFYLSAIGMICALANFIFYRKIVKQIGSLPDMKPFRWGRFFMVVAFSIALIIVTAILLEYIEVAFAVEYVLAGASVVLFFYFMSKVSERVAKRKMFVAFILIVQATWFYILYQQMYLSVTFFSLKNIFPSFLGIPMNQVSFQGFDPLVIVIFSPLLAALFISNAKKGKPLKVTTKFTIGFFLCTIAFFILWASTHFATPSGLISSWWIVLFYLFQSIGEILIAAIGLAMVGELVPDNYLGFVYGLFFIATAIGSLFGSFVSDLSVAPPSFTPIQTLTIYGNFFFYLGAASLVVAIIILLVKPYLDKYISVEKV